MTAVVIAALLLLCAREIHKRNQSEQQVKDLCALLADMPSPSYEVDAVYARIDAQIREEQTLRELGVVVLDDRRRGSVLGGFVA